MASTFPLFIADAFTRRAFRGNSAAICLLPFGKDITKNVRQDIAAEMNLSETAFISLMNPVDSFETGKRFGLQWFTPTCEVSLCGHATLASAAVLFSECGNKSDVLEFETLSGLLKAKKLPTGRIEIDLPAYDVNNVDVKEYETVVKTAVGTTKVQDVVLSHSRKLLVRLHDSLSRKDLEALTPESGELLKASDKIVGLIITLKASGEDCKDEDGNKYDFISRYFAPWLGVFEDPVTGSAHSVLGPYWSQALNKDELYARQCSPRGGDIHIKVSKDRVYLSGEGIVVIKGQIKF